MSAAFTHLSTPLRIGAVELKNRMFFPGHGTGLPDNNVPGDRHITYLTARARGGALIVTEIAQVEERAIYSAQALRIVGDHQIPAYQQLADAIHAEGSHVVVQLFHAEGDAYNQMAEGRGMGAVRVTDRRKPRDAAADERGRHPRGDRGVCTSSATPAASRYRQRGDCSHAWISAVTVPEPEGQSSH